VHHRSIAAVVAAALLLGAAACAGDDDSDQASGQPSDSGDEGRATSGGVPLGPANEGIDGVEAFRVDSNAHTEDNLTYDLAPPVGGEHFPVPATCGFYESEPPPEELMVHDLEHGAIWMAYEPGLPDDQLAVLRDLVGRQAKVTATPFEGGGAPLVLSAWGRQLKLDDANDPRLVAFIEQYRNSANAPEPTVACQGAGEPAVISPA
jgi:hypothetical protein